MITKACVRTGNDDVDEVMMTSSQELEQMIVRIIRGGDHVRWNGLEVDSGQYFEMGPDTE